jgi:hypothetical protein
MANVHSSAMISRIWHGWTTPQNADKYEALLKEEIFVGIQERHIKGFKWRELGTVLDFVTLGHEGQVLK